MRQVPIQATTRCAQAFTHTLLSHHRSLPLTHTRVSLSHSAPPSHYLLVKPVPELGEETKRHGADYFWKNLRRRHFTHPPVSAPPRGCVEGQYVRQPTSYTIQITVITGKSVFVNDCKTRKLILALTAQALHEVFLSQA